MKKKFKVGDLVRELNSAGEGRMLLGVVIGLVATQFPIEGWTHDIEVKELLVNHSSVCLPLDVFRYYPREIIKISR